MPKSIRRKGVIAIALVLVAVICVASLAFFTDRASHSMQFTTAKFTAEGYELTRTAPVGPFCAGEDVTATLKESNTGDDDANSVISMKATWVSPDTALSIFGNANNADNAKLSVDGNNVSYKVSSDKRSITFDLPKQALAKGTSDAARELTLNIPASFKSTGRIDFTFEKVVVGMGGTGFTKEFSRTELNAAETLDYSVRVGWAASSIANQNGKALMGYLTDKNSSGKYGIEFEFAFNYNTSPMKDFASKTDAKWSYYKDKADRLTFVEGMTSIGNYAFPGFSAVKSVSFPSTVKTIGVSAFDASGLTGTVTIPATVKEIKSLAFGNLPNVKTFTFGHTTDSLTLPDNTAAGKRNAGAFYVPMHVDTTVNSTVEAIMYGYKWHDGYDNRRLVPTLNARDTWFRTDSTVRLDETKLETITFADYHIPVTGETSWDASDPSAPGAVTAYLSADKTSLVLAGNGYGLIFANKDSSQAFSNLTALKTVSNTDLLDTRNATTMADMFSSDEALANISVSTWNVSKVTDMSNMFLYCDSLPSIDLKKNTCTAKDGSGQYAAWNTAALKNTSKMFMDYSGQKHALTTVDATGWDTSKLEDASYMFMECRGLTAIKGIEDWNVDSLKDAQNMFQDCQKLQTINVANWNTASLKNASVMFSSCKALRSIDISKWDMSKVTSSGAMFSYCESLTDLTLPKNLVVIGDYFAGNCPKLKTITFNQPAGTNVQLGSEAFVVEDNGKSEGTSGYIKYTPVNPMGTKVVTTNQDVLDYNWASDHRGYKVEIKNVEGGTLTGAPVAAYNGSKAVVAINGKTVTFTPAVANAYNGATIQYSQGGTTKTITLDKNTKTWIIPVVDDKVTEADIIVTPKWKKPVLAAKNTWYKGTVAKSAITGIEIMDSYNGTSVQSWDASAAQDGSVTAYLLSDNKLIIAGIGAGKVIANADSTGAFSGFWNAASFTGLNLLDTSNVTNMSSMFSYAKVLTDLDVSKFNTSKVTDMSSMFEGCYAVTGLPVGDFKTSKVTNMDRVFTECKALTSLDVSGWDTSTVTTMSGTFSYCGALTNDLNLTGWDTSKVKNMNGMFRYCKKLTSLDLSGFNTAQVKDMGYMFESCSTLPSVDVSKFNTAKVTNMEAMFSACDGLTSLNLSGFNTAQVTDMSNMFGACANLTSVNVSSFDTSRVTDMENMFSCCYKLASLDVSQFNTAQVTKMGGLFDRCYKLTSLNLGGWDTAKVTSMRNMFNGCRTLQTIKLSKDFKFVGTDGYLPKPDSAYIPRATGNWYIVGLGNTPCYTPAQLAAVVRVRAVTYTAIPIEIPGGGDDRTEFDVDWPKQIGKLIYNGSAQSPSWSGYDTAKMTIGGTTSGTNAGTYTAKFTPKDGYCWPDGTADTVSVTWKIGKATVSVPSQKGTLTYTGNALSPSWNNYSSASLTLGGKTSGTNAGSYTATFTPTANYQWSDGTTTAKSVTWKINRAAVSVPSQSGTLTYNGNARSPSWSGYDTAKMTIGGTTSGTNAGTYTAKFTPKDGYCWPDGTADTVSVTWKIGKATVSVPSQKGTLTYTGNALSPSWNNYSSASLTLGGKTSGTNAGSYTATFTPTANYQWSDGTTTAKSVTWKINRAAVSVPSQSGTLTYNGNARSPSWSGYDTAKMTIGGTTSGTNAGTYTAKFTPTANYQWSDGTTAAKSVTWKIGKAAGSLSISKSSATIDYNATTTTFTVTRAGDGTISVASDNTNIATVSVNGNTVTVTKKGPGTAKITVFVAAGTNYTAPASKVCTVACKTIPTLAKGNTWYKGTAAEKTAITQIEIANTYSGTATKSWDASAAQDGSVKAYINGTKLIIAGNGYGKVMANANSSNAFNGFTGVTSFTGLNKLDTSKVTNMSYMFYSCSVLTSLDVSGFNTSKVTNMKSMFAGCNKLASLDVSKFNTSRVTNMAGTFANCNKLTSLDVSKFNTSKVTDVHSMFYRCYEIKTLDLSSFDTSRVTNMKGMFEKCVRLQEVTLGKSFKFVGTDGYLPAPSSAYITGADGNWYDIADRAGYTPAALAGVTRTETRTYVADNKFPMLAAQQTWYKGTAAEKTAITQIEIANTYSGTATKSWDASAAQDGSVKAYINGTKLIIAGNGYGKVLANADSRSAFSGFTGVTSLTGLNKLDTSKVTNMGEMFYNCKVLTSLDVSGFNTSKVTNMREMFCACSALTSLDLSGFDTSNVTNMQTMFGNCESLTSLDVSGFNTSNVTNMRTMFYNCNALTSLDVSGFDTSKVTNMIAMFANCYALTSLDLSGFDTSNVTTMEGMFDDCYALTSLDLSGFDTSKVTGMDFMFKYCESLTTIYVSELWSTAKVTSSQGMFSNCSHLRNWSADKTDATYANYTSSGYLTYKSNTHSMALTSTMPAEGFDEETDSRESISVPKVQERVENTEEETKVKAKANTKKDASESSVAKDTVSSDTEPVNREDETGKGSASSKESVQSEGNNASSQAEGGRGAGGNADKTTSQSSEDVNNSDSNNVTTPDSTEKAA